MINTVLCATTGNLKNNLVDNFQYKTFLKELNKIAYRTNFKIIIKLHYNDYVIRKLIKIFMTT